MYRKLFLLINFFVSIILAIVFSNFSIVIVNLLLMAILFYITKKENDILFRHIIRIFLISVLSMIILYFCYIFKYGEPYYNGGSDDKNFEIWAYDSIEHGNYTIKSISEDRQFKYYNCNGFIWFMSTLIRFCNVFGGYHTIIIRLMNIYFLLYIAILCFKYCRINITSDFNIDKKILYLMGLFPNALFISIHGFRDTIYVLIIFSIFYLFTNFKERSLCQKILIMLYMVVSIYFIYYLRTIGILYILIIVITGLLLNEKYDKKLNLILMSVILFIIFIILNYRFDLISKFSGSLDRYNNYILEDATGLSKIVFTTNLLPFGIFLRLVYGLMFPAPTGVFLHNFDINSICNCIISIGTIFQIYMLPYLLKNIKKIDNVFIIFSVIFISIIFSTFNFRHFLMLYPFMFILVIRELVDTSPKKKRQNTIIMTYFILLMIICYLGFKILN